MASDSQVNYDDQLVRKISLRLIPFMLILYVVSYLDRINISFAALQMNKDLHISDEQYGLGSGIFFFGYCIFGILSNLVIEKIGPRKWISSIMILWGFITVGMCLVQNEVQFYTLRFILGVAEAGFFPGMILYLTYWFSPKYYGAAVARFMTAIPVAGLVGSAVAAFALKMEAFGLAGWMWLFIVTGIPAIVLGATVLAILADSPHKATWLTKEEVETIEQATVHVSTSDETKTSSGFLTAIREIRVWRCALLYFTLTVSMYGFQLWLPQIIKAFGSSDDSITAGLSAIPALFQALGMLIIAGHSDKTGERRFHVVTATCCTFAGLALSCFAPLAWLKLTGLCLAAFGIWGSVGPFWALSTNSLRRETHATGIAVINSVGNLGGFAGPFIVGWIKQNSAASGGFNDSLIALAVASVLAGILAATSPRPDSSQAGGSAH